MSSLTPSRRTVIRTAAWSVPVVSVATAAPAFAVSPTDPTYQNVTGSFVYDARVGGETGPIVGQVTVDVEASVPLTAPRGATLAPTTTKSTVTIPANLADLLKQVYLAGAVEIDGTSVSTSLLTGAVTTSSVSNLVIPRTPMPGAGQPLITVATGQSDGGLTIPADNPTGQVIITMGQPQSQLTGYTADGTPTANKYDSVLWKRVGTTDADYFLAAFEIV